MTRSSPASYVPSLAAGSSARGARRRRGSRPRDRPRGSTRRPANRRSAQEAGAAIPRWPRREMTRGGPHRQLELGVERGALAVEGDRRQQDVPQAKAGLGRRRREVAGRERDSGERSIAQPEDRPVRRPREHADVRVAQLVGVLRRGARRARDVEVREEPAEVGVGEARIGRARAANPRLAGRVVAGHGRLRTPAARKRGRTGRERTTGMWIIRGVDTCAVSSGSRNAAAGLVRPSASRAQDYQDRGRFPRLAARSVTGAVCFRYGDIQTSGRS